MKSNLITENYPLLSLMFRDDYDAELESHLSNSYSKLLKVNEKIIPKGAIYLNGWLHDSWVTSIENTGQELHIWLNEFSTHCFADACVDMFALRIPHNKRIMPLCLRFIGLKLCRVCWIKGSRKMIPVSKEKYLIRFSEYLKDEVTICENDHISMGILFWSKRESPRERRHLLLQVESAHLAIEEHQPQAFIELFGNDHADMFNKYWNERQKCQYYFDYSGALAFLKSQTERDQKSP